MTPAATESLTQQNGSGRRRVVLPPKSAGLSFPVRAAESERELLNQALERMLAAQSKILSPSDVAEQRMMFERAIEFGTSELVGNFRNEGWREILTRMRTVVTTRRPRGWLKAEQKIIPIVDQSIAPSYAEVIGLVRAYLKLSSETTGVLFDDKAIAEVVAALPMRSFALRSEVSSILEVNRQYGHGIWPLLVLDYFDTQNIHGRRSSSVAVANHDIVHAGFLGLAHPEQKVLSAQELIELMNYRARVAEFRIAYEGDIKTMTPIGKAILEGLYFIIGHEHRLDFRLLRDDSHAARHFQSINNELPPKGNFYLEAFDPLVQQELSKRFEIIEDGWNSLLGIIRRADPTALPGAYDARQYL